MNRVGKPHTKNHKEVVVTSTTKPNSVWIPKQKDVDTVEHTQGVHFM